MKDGMQKTKLMNFQLQSEGNFKRQANPILG